jgi:hypothetical protein
MAWVCQTEEHCKKCGIRVKNVPYWRENTCHICWSRAERCRGCYNHTNTLHSLFCPRCKLDLPLCWAPGIACQKTKLYPLLRPVVCKTCFYKPLYPLPADNSLCRCLSCGQLFFKSFHSLPTTCNACCMSVYTRLLPQFISVLDIVPIIAFYLEGEYSCE